MQQTNIVNNKTILMEEIYFELEYSLVNCEYTLLLEKRTSNLKFNEWNWIKLRLA